MNHVMRAAAASIVTAVALSAPAAAGEGEYVSQLHERYPFLTEQQLTSEGNRVCAYTDAGMKSPDAVAMVGNDLGVSVQAALDIVSAAIGSLC